VAAITQNVKETDGVHTLRFDTSIHGKPGQFVMVWLPGIDEIPMSLSYVDGEAGITVKTVGDATRALCAMQPGQRVGVRGPHGHGYDVSGNNVLVVAGGTGVSSLAPLVEQLASAGKTINCALGAKTSSELYFIERLEAAGAKLHIATDDGSQGHEGFVTDLARKLLESGGYDSMAACGPEPMLVRLLELSEATDMPIQVSLERHMKCGIGICDSCSMDGLQVCRDGPVFDGKTLAASKEFGKAKRDECGRLVPMH